MFRSLKVAAVLLTAFALQSSAAIAQDWPNKPLKVVVPLTAGSATDVLARVVFEQVSKQVGQNIIIENRGGGGGERAQASRGCRTQPG